ncbi:hypothetical protein [Bifidobacterium oedipodis]|uniref:Uncharacterized protein n=1 Tax=Bifidobacterium oedipodis TaxID=2675322 RepID=A0A7Y0HRV4_9BIFI|nr:hypothetical protein [Bifidobacterium sp. DSM 109957]NMM92913.1 hypothetical protein [Bifidobacterium sp. DSM 109957]
MNISRVKKVLIGIVAGGALAFGIPASAQAATHDVYGYLNTGGALIQYSTFRSHLAGNASLRVTNNVGTYSRFGLRTTDGVQRTASLQYNGSGGDQSWGWVASGSYALNGRMGARSGADNYWAGLLTM